MTIIFDRDGVLVFPGHDLRVADLLDEARVHLTEAGYSPFEIDVALTPRVGMVVQAYWGGEDVGFCPPEHPDHEVTPVTVLNVGADVLPPVPASRAS